LHLSTKLIEAKKFIDMLANQNNTHLKGVGRK